jgi:hypothetical protein
MTCKTLDDRETDCTSTNGLVAPRRVRTQIRTAQLDSIRSSGLGTIAAALGKPEFTSCRSDLSVHLPEHVCGGGSDENDELGFKNVESELLLN